MSVIVTFYGSRARLAANVEQEQIMWSNARSIFCSDGTVRPFRDVWWARGLEESALFMIGSNGNTGKAGSRSQYSRGTSIRADR